MPPVPIKRDEILRLASAHPFMRRADIAAQVGASKAYVERVITDAVAMGVNPGRMLRQRRAGGRHIQARIDDSVFRAIQNESAKRRMYPGMLVAKLLEVLAEEPTLIGSVLDEEA